MTDTNRSAVRIRMLLHLRRFAASGLAALSAVGCRQGVLDPQGPVAAAEKTLLFNSVAIMLTIVLPVIVATLTVAWWFRASNPRARYRPTWTYSGKVEVVVWTIPMMIILLLGGIGWISSHDLDPAKPLSSSEAAVEVQVVALDWKWLFIYPRQGVASVNRLVVPANTPVSLQLTSATVMNSFFVPQLAGQIYTMAGMKTHLNMLADHPGRFPGLSAQFSGDGFSGMRFTVDAMSPDEFAAWVSATRKDGPVLDPPGYAELSKPTAYVTPFSYRAVDPALFERIVTLRLVAESLGQPDQAAKLQSLFAKTARARDICSAN